MIEAFLEAAGLTLDCGEWMDWYFATYYYHPRALQEGPPCQSDYSN